MLVPFPQLLAERAARGAAVGAFTSYDLETASGVLRSATDAGAPVMLLLSRDAFAASAGDDLLAALRALADRADVPCCLQLDHVGDLELMRRALSLGCGAVMADGSRLPLEENRALVSEAVRLAAEHGGHAEAELGHVAGGEDVARATAAGAFTDPPTAARFARETGAACLAVSIGNVHGTYREPPDLDWERLRAIRAATDTPLSLHGASGIADADVRRTIVMGVAKVNVNTELRAAYLGATAARIDDVRDGLRLLELHDHQRDAVAHVAAAKLANYETETA